MLPVSFSSLKMFRQDRQRRHFNEKERAAIVALTEAGQSIRQIANVVDCSKATVSLWQKRYELSGDVERQVGSGRPRKTTAAEDRRLVAVVRANPITTAQEIAGKMVQ